MPYFPPLPHCVIKATIPTSVCVLQIEARLQAVPGKSPSTLEGEYYQGFCIDGERDGRGKLETDAGDSYVGDFRQGRIHGRGTYTWANGDKYVGQWKGGLRHGHGSLDYASGGS
jgi:hypothetical protein